MATRENSLTSGLKTRLRVVGSCVSGPEARNRPRKDVSNGQGPHQILARLRLADVEIGEDRFGARSNHE